MDDLTLTTWLVAGAAAFCIGVAKTGFSGVSLIAVYLLANEFGAKASIGLALPFLMVGDLLVYPAFRKFASWKPVWSLLAPTLAGMALGAYLLGKVSDGAAKFGIGLVILLMAVMYLVKLARPAWTEAVAHSRGFGSFAGVFGGLATMMANSAGPVIQLFLLSRNFGKLDLLGVGARFFLLINFIKLPLSGGLGLITRESLGVNLFCAPLVGLGVWLGAKWIHRIPQKGFEWMIVGFAVLMGARLMAG